MSTKKFVSILFVALVVFSVVVVSVATATAETDISVKAGVIVEINIFNSSIRVIDNYGSLWEVFIEFDEDTNIHFGNVVAMLMWKGEIIDIEVTSFNVM